MRTVTSLREPVIAAPMAGGPSTPELVAAVGEAGGLGFLAGGYLSAEALRDQIGRVRALTTAPFGANLFVPDRLSGVDSSGVDTAAVGAYAARLVGEAARLGVEVGPPTGGDDGWASKLAVLAAERVPVVSFAFGLPRAEELAPLREAGAAVLVTVTTPDEAVQASTVDAVDGLIVQGVEAGAHRGGFVDVAGVGEYGLLALVRLVARETERPLIAAGGIADGPGIAAVLVAGAVAAQLGTAFLRCPEAGTSALHREALAAGSDRETVLTRAFTGRRARALVNRFVAEHTGGAPAAYPQVHQLTAPLRAAARAAGDAEVVNLWAGQAYPLAEAVPAGELVRRLGAGARATLTAVAARIGPG